MKIHVSDGKVNGGSVGAIVCGVIIALFFNLIASGVNDQVPLKAPNGFRVLFAIFTLTNIPIAIFGQKAIKKIQVILFGNSRLRLVTRNFWDILTRRFLGALMFTIAYDAIIFGILVTLFRN